MATARRAVVHEYGLSEWVARLLYTKVPSIWAGDQLFHAPSTLHRLSRLRSKGLVATPLLLKNIWGRLTNNSGPLGRLSSRQLAHLALAALSDAWRHAAPQPDSLKVWSL